MEPPDIDHTYYDGRHYHNRYQVIKEDIPFWIRRVKEFGEPVLELAVGTGRVSIPLAKEGFQVTGIDVSDSMMTEGRRRASEAGAEVEWVEGDIRNFQLGKKFNTIIFPLNTVCHFLDLRDLEACLSCVKEHLAQKGRFIVDAIVPSAERLARDPDERFFNSEYPDPDGGGIVKVYESNRYDPASQINHVKFYYQIPGRSEEIVEELNMRMYFPEELDALLKYNGFGVDAKYGDYDDAPFGPVSPKQMIVCGLPE